MRALILNSRDFFTKNEISNYVTQQFFRCVSPFLSWMKKGEICKKHQKRALKLVQNSKKEKMFQNLFTNI